jgi:hypothetical protein
MQLMGLVIFFDAHIPTVFLEEFHNRQFITLVFLNQITNKIKITPKKLIFCCLHKTLAATNAIDTFARTYSRAMLCG